MSLGLKESAIGPHTISKKVKPWAVTCTTLTTTGNMKHTVSLKEKT